jgi:hypothetical protein
MNITCHTSDDINTTVVLPHGHPAGQTHLTHAIRCFFTLALVLRLGLDCPSTSTGSWLSLKLGQFNDFEYQTIRIKLFVSNNSYQTIFIGTSCACISTLVESKTLSMCESISERISHNTPSLLGFALRNFVVHSAIHSQIMLPAKTSCLLGQYFQPRLLDCSAKYCRRDFFDCSHYQETPWLLSLPRDSLIALTTERLLIALTTERLLDCPHYRETPYCCHPTDRLLRMHVLSARPIACCRDSLHRSAKSWRPRILDYSLPRDTQQ